MSSLKVAASRLRQAMSFKQGPKSLQMLHGDNLVGTMTFREPGAIHATEIFDDKYKGMGLGKKMYGEAMRRFGVPGPDGRLHMSSDGQLSADAQRVWHSIAKNPAYNVQPHPMTVARKLPSGDVQRRWDLKRIEGGTPESGLFSASLPGAAKLGAEYARGADDAAWAHGLPR